jgi:hemerythrin-like domain-containing protein
MGIAGLRERAEEVREFFASNLVAHFRAEEEVLFPFIRAQLPESKQIVDQLLKEHDQIRKTMPQLQDEAGLGKLIFDLGDLLERHIRKEERELFPLFERHLDPMKAAAVADAIKEILDGRPIK